LGDVKLKQYLYQVIEAELMPIRERRANFAQNPAEVYEMLQEGSRKANVVANQTLAEVREAIGLNYFDHK
ncbi:MAG: tryptophan--tRNA ligase, partial [Lactobacillus iners]|nr:tryptophan--tRNA ligase [Lactobacillus iners]